MLPTVKMSFDLSGKAVVFLCVWEADEIQAEGAPWGQRSLSSVMRRRMEEKQWGWRREQIFLFSGCETLVQLSLWEVVLPGQT